MRRQNCSYSVGSDRSDLSLTCRRSTWAMSLAAGMVLFWSPASSQELLGEDVAASANFTLTHGLTFRLEDPDSTHDINSDDGTKNYKKGGLVSNTSSLTAEFELSSGNLGLFIRMNGFYDFENADGMRERTQLSEDALDIAGRDFRVLDLYASAFLEPGGIPLDLRLGNQVLNWGESTFIPNGINVINPIDVSRIRTPGAELRDALVPVPMLYAAVEVVPNLSFEGFYQFGWQRTEIDPVGTYFSTTDYVGAGGTHAFLTLPNFLSISDEGRAFGPEPLQNAINTALNGAMVRIPQPPGMQPLRCTASQGIEENCKRQGLDPHFLAVSRSADREPPNTGQYGLAMRYFSPELNDTEFGVYFLNTHSRLPLVSGRVAGMLDLAASGVIAERVSTNSGVQREVASMVAQENAKLPTQEKLKVSDEFTKLVGALSLDRFAKESRYFVEYPKDIKTLGLSFNTLLGASGWALQGEYSFRPDLPLQRAEEAVLREALSPWACTIRSGECTAPETFDALGKLDEVVRGYVNRNVSQAQVTATQIFGPVLGSDALGLIAEVALMRVHGMPNPANNALEATGSANAEATSWGYRGALWLDYSNAIGAVSLSPYIQFQHDVNGSSPLPFGPFADGRKAVTLGVGANYLERWSANVSYTAHTGSNNPLADRDFASMSFSYSF